MRSIQPKPTTFNGITYRSRSEARWACLLHHLSVEAYYEPYEFTNPQGWTYLPDFWLPCPNVGAYLPGSSYLEIKPSYPSDDYLALLSRFDLDGFLYIGVGNFYRQHPTIFEFHKTETGGRLEPLRMQAVFPGYSFRFYQLVANWRFDLR